MDGNQFFVDEKVCAARHQATESRLDRANDDIKDVWKSVEAIRLIVQGQSVKIAYIVGGITVFVNIISLAFQFYGK
jgi:hypothetical protein